MSGESPYGSLHCRFMYASVLAMVSFPGAVARILFALFLRRSVWQLALELVPYLGFVGGLDPLP